MPYQSQFPNRLNQLTNWCVEYMRHNSNSFSTVIVFNDTLSPHLVWWNQTPRNANLVASPFQLSSPVMTASWQEGLLKLCCFGCEKETAPWYWWLGASAWVIVWYGNDSDTRNTPPPGASPCSCSQLAGYTVHLMTSCELSSLESLATRD